MIFETHAHYDDEAFDEDRETLLASMQQNMIGCLVNVGASLESTQTSIQLAEQYPYIYAAAGVHPSESAALDEAQFEWLAAQCAHQKYKRQSQTRQFRRNGLCASLSLQKRSKSQ